MSASIVNRSVSVCNFETYKIEQSANVIIKPLQLLTHAISVGLSCPYIPENWHLVMTLLYTHNNNYSITKNDHLYASSNAPTSSMPIHEIV